MPEIAIAVACITVAIVGVMLLLVLIDVILEKLRK